jgi:4-amino-4-deoxy-L-arabinose transferase-like glycosyltransferase
MVISLPWYILCYLRNGSQFLNDLFWKQQFQRLTSGALLHVRPWWFYLPVLLGLLAPWTPLLLLLTRHAAYRDARRAFLLALALWGVAFFSLAPNKLPGYILPLLPAVAALMGTALTEWDRTRTPLAACALLLILYPIAAPLLPYAVAEGISRAPWPRFQLVWLVPFALAAVVGMLERHGRRMAAVVCIAAGAAAGTLYLKGTADGPLERMASAESLWREAAATPGGVCVDEAVDRLDRAFRYGLNYYSGTPLPGCAAAPKARRIVHSPAGPPYLTAKGDG